MGTQYILNCSMQLQTSFSALITPYTRLISTHPLYQTRLCEIRDCDSTWHACPHGQHEALKKLAGCSWELRLSDMGRRGLGRKSVFSFSQKWRLEHKSMAQIICDMGGGRCLRCTGSEMHQHEVWREISICCHGNCQCELSGAKIQVVERGGEKIKVTCWIYSHKPPSVAKTI